MMDALANKTGSLTTPYSDIIVVLQKVLRDEDPGYRLHVIGKGASLLNPEDAMPFPSIFARHVKAVSVSRNTWYNLIKDNKPAFQEANNHVQLVRERRQDPAFAAARRGGGSGTVVAVAANPPSSSSRRVGAKSSATEAALSSSSSSSSSSSRRPAAAVATGPEVTVEMEREWRAVHRNMEAHVVTFQNRPPSPPPSPSLTAAAPVCHRRSVAAATAAIAGVRDGLTASESLFTATFTATNKSAVAGVSLAGLFEVFDTDRELMPATYAPAFDRNDLYFTNAKDARRLFALDAVVSKAAPDRVARGLPAVDTATFPYLYVVALRFRGAATFGLRECSYVTWCLKLDYPTFIDRVLDATIVCNAEITKLVADCTSAVGAEHRGRLFALELVDDSVGTVNHRSLPVFLASLTSYIDQYSSSTVKTKGAASSPTVSAIIPHARHRLIFESGSLAAYRVNWLYARNMREVLAELAGLHASLARCIDTVITFYDRYYYHLTTPASSLNSSAVKHAAHEVNCLWDLFQSQFGTDVLGHLTGVGIKYLMLKSVWHERRESVHAAYAEAQVQLVREKASIPHALALAYGQTLEDAEYQRVCNRYLETAKMMRDMVEVKEKMVEAWPEAHPNLHDPVGIFNLLRSLVVLKLWDAPCVAVAADDNDDAAAPAATAATTTTLTRQGTCGSVSSGRAGAADDDGVVIMMRCEELRRVLTATTGPPKHVTSTDLRQAYHRAMRETHPDKCSSADATTRGQVVNFAYELVSSLYDDDGSERAV